MADENDQTKTQQAGAVSLNASEGEARTDPPPEQAGDAAITEPEASQAVAEGAAEEVGSPPDTETVVTPSPPLESASDFESSDPGAGTSEGSGGSDAFAEHPEYFVGGAFAGGLVVAQILKRFRRE